MPATFAHCLLAREAVTRLEKGNFFTGVLKLRNHFVTIGATGPDYPYLTDVLKNQVMHIGHNWANRMHYENVGLFIREGVRRLSLMDRDGNSFKNCLAWFAGYVSHVVADSYMHPVVNSIVHGTYIFTHTEHGRCELVQDIYLFNKKTGTDICKAAARDANTFGYLNILDDGSDPADPERIHPDIRQFWSELLKAAHSNASQFHASIDPDTWHKNYKKRVDFAADGRSIFRHVLDVANAPRYVPLANIQEDELRKYVSQVETPIGHEKAYDELFDQAVNRIVGIWQLMFACIENAEEPSAVVFKNWNLDTGVDESKIDLWTEA